VFKVWTQSAAFEATERMQGAALQKEINNMSKNVTPSKTQEVVLFLEKDREAIGYMTPSVMKELFFISNFDGEDPDSSAQDRHGYQRNPMSERIPRIARFYLDGHIDDAGFSKVTPLILSVRLKASDQIEKFVQMLNENHIQEIKKLFGPAVVSVVDGQHRYLGLVKANQDDPTFNPRVPILCVFGLSFNDEARFFDVINIEQKKLPKALIEITKADATEFGVTSHAQRVRLIATMLARHDDSVWQQKVNLTGARDPNKPVTFEGLRRSTASMFPSGLIERIEAKGLLVDKVARDYWRLVSEACPEAWNDVPLISVGENGETIETARKYRIKELVGVGSLARLGNDIIASALEHDAFDQRLGALTGRLSEVDWEKRSLDDDQNPWMQSQAGFAGQSELYSTLYRWVYLNDRP